MERQFTATVYIIEQERVLLIFHKKMQKWLPPGGHLDPNETPPDGARREALEETGLELELIPQEQIWIDRWNAKSFERPYMCLLEEIPAYHDKPAHQHMDLIYLARPIGGKAEHNQQEVEGMRWFSLVDLAQLIPDQEIFEETLITIRNILTSQKEKNSYAVS
jgi:8-oxo-dGTP pyrophosphatase MutT (NUDIX family)